MAEQLSPCPLCGRAAKLTDLGDFTRVMCELCGDFKVTRILLRTDFADLPPNEVTEVLPYLGCHTRQASERGQVVTLDRNNWKEFALSHKGTSVSRKVTKLLELIASRSRPGDQIKIIESTDYPLVDAVSKSEMQLLLNYLIELGYLHDFQSDNYLLSVEGWKQIQATNVEGIPGKCFVAMWFDDSMKDAYESGIYPALKIDCKMEPVRIDLVPHNDNIVDKIIAEIRTCQFMVADFTGHRGGVYFEAGFAKGLGRQVIMTCRKDEFEKVHFDIKQFSHIIWKDPSDLRQRLADKVKATIP